MDKDDYWFLVWCVGMLTCGMWCHNRLYKKLAADVAFLRDVARETDALRSDHE